MEREGPRSAISANEDEELFLQAPEPSLKGRPPHTAAAGPAATPTLCRRLTECACASLEPLPFPAFSQAPAGTLR